jgi:hypothetical protein
MQYTFVPFSEGFGAQLQKLMWTILYVERVGGEFIYTPFSSMAHNYTNESDFIDTIESYIGLKDKYINNNDNLILKPTAVDVRYVLNTIEANIDSYHSDNTFNTLRDKFLCNKISPYDSSSTHIAVHVRRPNSHDNRIEGTDTPDSYYLSIMYNIREARKGEHLTFHIYSQGNESSFLLYLDFKDNITDIKLHLNESIPGTFNGLLFSNILITSKSSLSYIAALLSKAEVHYKKFWHPPLSHWKSYD